MTLHKYNLTSLGHQVTNTPSPASPPLHTRDPSSPTLATPFPLLSLECRHRRPAEAVGRAARIAAEAVAVGMPAALRITHGRDAVPLDEDVL